MTTRFVVGDSDVVWIDHNGIARETDKATLYKIHGGEKWVPKSVIVDEGAEQLGVKSWWAEKNDIEGDW